MKILLTVVDDERERRDVLVNAAAGTPVRSLAPQLLPGDGPHGEHGPPDAGASDVPLYLGSRLLDPGSTLAAAGIRDGSVLGVGRPVPPACPEFGPSREEMPTPARPGSAPVAEVQVIGGPLAGQVGLLAMGGHLLGPVPGASVRLEGRGVPESGVRVAVRADGTAIVELPDGDARVRLSLPEAPAPRSRADVAALPPAPVAEEEPARPEPADLPRGWTPWPLDGELVVGEHLLRVVRPTAADAAVVPSPKGVGLDFNRPPRMLPPLQPETFRLPGPPQPPKHRSLPFMVMIAPMFLGFGMVYFLSLIHI